MGVTFEDVVRLFFEKKLRGDLQKKELHQITGASRVTVDGFLKDKGRVFGFNHLTAWSQNTGQPISDVIAELYALCQEIELKGRVVVQTEEAARRVSESLETEQLAHRQQTSEPPEKPPAGRPDRTRRSKQTRRETSPHAPTSHNRKH